MRAKCGFLLGQHERKVDNAELWWDSKWLRRTKADCRKWMLP